jgi:hypothetical protein
MGLFICFSIHPHSATGDSDGSLEPRLVLGLETTEAVTDTEEEERMGGHRRIS